MSVSAGQTRQDAIMFGTCADFRIMFFESLAHGCEKAAPDLAQAMRRIAGEFYKPELTSREQIAYSTQLIEAAAPHISPRCQPDRGLKLLEDDYGRTINDLTLTYREPACEPDPDLFVLTTTDQPASQAFGMAYVDSGVHYFALALRPFLSSLGVMMLRKLLFCSIIQNFPGKYWGPRLPTDPTREALPEPFFESLRQP